MGVKGDWHAFAAPPTAPDLSPDWRAFLATLCDALGACRSVREPLPLVGSDWYGSSANFAREVREEYPDLEVPERAVEPLCGKPCWTPADEELPPPGEPCRLCGGSVPRGSFAYCPACLASGFEWKLGRQLRMAGLPPPEPHPDRGAAAEVRAWVQLLESRGGVPPDRAPRSGTVRDRVLTRRQRRAEVRRNQKAG